MSTIEGTERLFLGKLSSIDGLSPPTTELPPALPAGSLLYLENLYSFQIGPTTSAISEEIRQIRFHIIEVEFAFVTSGGVAYTQIDVGAYLSRKNPTPAARDMAVDSDADTWGCFGLQTAYATAAAGQGKRLRFAVGGARYIALAGSSPSGGSGTRHVDAYVYGIVERHGAIS